MSPPKSGFLSSEFWATVGTTALALFHALPAPVQLAVSGAAAVYTVCRTVIKAAHAKQGG